MSFWKLIALVYLWQEVCDVFLEADCLGVSLAEGLRCLFGGHMISILVGWRRIFRIFFDFLDLVFQLSFLKDGNDVMHDA